MTALNEKHFKGNQVNDLMVFIILFAVFSIHCSCIYVPVPASDLRSVLGVIPNETIKSLKVGETTREDLLILVGDPDELYEHERFFIYQWEILEGVFVVPGGGDAVYKVHYLCVEFDEKNRIKRLAHIKSGFFKSLDKAREETYEWMSKSN